MLHDRHYPTNTPYLFCNLTDSGWSIGLRFSILSSSRRFVPFLSILSSFWHSLARYECQPVGKQYWNLWGVHSAKLDRFPGPTCSNVFLSFDLSYFGLQNKFLMCVVTEASYMPNQQVYSLTTICRGLLGRGFMYRRQCLRYIHEARAGSWPSQLGALQTYTVCA